MMQDLKMQIGQLASSMSQLQSAGFGNLPSKTTPNLKGGNANVMTLRSVSVESDSTVSVESGQTRWSQTGLSLGLKCRKWGEFGVNSWFHLPQRSSWKNGDDSPTLIRMLRISSTRVHRLYQAITFDNLWLPSSYPAPPRSRETPLSFSWSDVATKLDSKRALAGLAFGQHVPLLSCWAEESIWTRRELEWLG
ncbi:hypothetical protein CR513_41461, partial [Mucuna pruriens]